MIKYLRKELKTFMDYSYSDKIKTIGGFCFMMYFPLFISWIWIGGCFVPKMIITNTIIILLIWLIDTTNEKR